jgi:hypothetical protein
MKVTKVLITQQLGQLQNVIKIQDNAFQDLYYENTRNELLTKGQKIAMELTHVIANNAELEANVVNQIRVLTHEIELLTVQFQNLQQKYNLIKDENTSIKIVFMQLQANLELHIPEFGWRNRIRQIIFIR